MSMRELLPLPAGMPAYLGLAEQVRSMVVEGRIAVGTRLPSERVLADQLGLSRTTVTRAYGELVEHGWASARRGSGTIVRVPTSQRSPSTPLIPHGGGDVLDLSAAAGLAPRGTARLIETALNWLPASLNSVGYEPFGAPHLRERIAEWFAGRGVPTDPDQVIVTPGAIAALNVALRTVLGSGEKVLVDSPTYPGALAALDAVRARPVSVALREGYDLDGWAAALRHGRVGAAYLIPDFHNPTGIVIAEDQRRQAAALLRQADCVAIIDETPAELRLDGGVSPAPWAAFDDRAISIGSLSKVLWGGIRIGWVRSPRPLLDALRTRAYQLTMGASALDQLVATSYLEDPAPTREEVLARMRQSRSVWAEEVSRLLPEWRGALPQGGLGWWVELPRPLSSQLSLAAVEHGLVLAPGQLFSADRTQANRLRLPLTLAASDVPEAVRRLRDAWDTVESASGRLPEIIAV